MLFAPISAVTNGSNTIVAGVAGKRVRVVNYTLIAAGAVNATWKSAGGTALSGALPLAAQAGVSSASPSVDMGGQQGVLETLAQGDALTLTLDAAVQVSGHLAYVLVP